MAKLSLPGIQTAIKSIFTGPRDVLGLDVGSYSVKIALVQSEGRAAKLKSWGVLPLDPKPEATPEEKKQQSVNLIRAYLIKNGIQVKNAATSISGSAIIVRYVKFPRLTKDELWATLPTEAEPFIPFDIKEVELGFHILGETVEEGQKKMETVLVAAKRDAVTQRIDVLQAAGLKPTIIDVDSFALENVFERVRNPKEEGLTTLYLNIGHNVTNLSIVDAGVTRVVRDVFIAGSTFTRAIMKALQCDYAKAEELKKAHGILLEADEKEKALQEGNREALGVSQALTGVLKDMVRDVNNSVDYYLSQGPERSVAQIMLVGGSAPLKNLAKHLTRELKVPVNVLNPFSFFKEPANVPPEAAPALGVAMGLALRKHWDWV